MALEIIMPRLSDSMEEGTILQWLVAEGDQIEPGQALAEIETDKANVTYEVDEGGTILSLSVSEGASVPVGAPIAVIGEPGEELPETPSAATLAKAAAPAASSNAPAPVSSQVASGSPGASPSARSAAARGSASASTTSAGARGGRPKASPLARRLAAQLGVNLAALAGSGPNGRVIRVDVERAATGADGGELSARGGEVGAAPLMAAPEPAAPRQAAAPPAKAREPVISAKGEPTVHQLTRLQQTVARRMAESRATVPDFELRCEVDMSAVVELRERLRQIADPAPSYNDFIVKAVALALREFPRVNASYRDGAVESYDRINVGIAVAANDALVVPTIFDADRMSLGEISRNARALAERVREATISPAELAGGTFTVSNLGMFGIDSFSAVINPPQAAILAVGSLKPRPVVLTDGQVAARQTLMLTLACDHRALYGADGARFLDRVRGLLERPDTLAL